MAGLRGSLCSNGACGQAATLRVRGPLEFAQAVHLSVLASMPQQLPAQRSFPLPSRQRRREHAQGKMRPAQLESEIRMGGSDAGSRDGGHDGSGPAQLSLIDIEAARAASDRLFFALLPDAAAVTEIDERSRRLRLQHGLRGKAIDPARLHVTLFHLGDFPAFPQAVVDAASLAGARLKSPPIAVEFDRVGTFAGANNLPFVLQAGECAAPLTAFQQALKLVLAKTGIAAPAKRPFTPHLTLMYSDRRIATEPIEPVRWTAREVVLVHSLIGQSRHLRIGQWPLVG
jgi:RNA 2',3'-cyclic 3'-phosphodiesterase